MITEKEKQNRAELFKLMQEHPELRVIPMVDEEVVCDDSHSWWFASWGGCRIQKIYDTIDRVYLKDDGEEEDILTRLKGWAWYDNATDEEVDAAIKELPWEEVITVNIELP